MSVKILAGKLKGLKLKVLDDSIVRPTSVLLRRKIFDSHQNLTNVHFIDLCAGSGAMGLEALSRGAELVNIVEKDNKIFKQLKNNLKEIESRDKSLGKRVLLSHDCASSWLNKNVKSWQADESQRTQLFPIIFLDPPYQEIELYYKLLKIIEKSALQGHLWLESDTQNGLTLDQLQAHLPLHAVILKSYRQSDHQIFKISFGL